MRIQMWEGWWGNSQNCSRNYTIYYSPSLRLIFLLKIWSKDPKIWLEDPKIKTTPTKQSFGAEMMWESGGWRWMAVDGGGW